MRIHKAGHGDLTALRALTDSSAAPHWSESVWKQMLCGAEEHRVVLIAKTADEIVGMLVGMCVADVAELESIVVAAGERRKGTGARLLDALRAWAIERGARSMELEVRASNSVAISFYRAHGFIEQGRRARYYHEPDEDAVLMSTLL